MSATSARIAADRLPHAPEIDIVVEVGPASSVLLAESEDATELVVGHGGLSAVGSVALACLHASCPVTVVPVGDRE